MSGKEPKGMSLIEDTILPSGLRRVHYLADSKAHDVAAMEFMVGKCSAAAYDDLVGCCYEEVGMWHGRVVWPVKGELVLMDGQKVLLWRISEGEKLSLVCEQLIWMFRAILDHFPGHVLVGAEMAVHTGKVVFERDEVILKIELDEKLHESCVMVRDEL